MTRIDRISIDPQILVGKPVIKGTRISVEQILRAIAGGMTHAEILESYPRLTEDDILAAVEYAADTIANEVVENV
jgi:uncharacterized protein (DUF433 family)